MSFNAVCFLHKPSIFNWIFFSALWLFLFQLSVHADQSVTLSWDATGDSNVAGYKIYYGVVSGIYTHCIDVGNVITATVFGLAPDTTYYFAATTYDTFGNESDYSNETTYHTPPATSTDGTEATLTPVTLVGGQLGFQLSEVVGHTYVVQASTDLINWVSVETNMAPFTFVDSAPALPQRFYRAIELAPVTPTAAAVLTSTSPVTGQFSLAVSGTTGALYVVQASTDLVNWVSVQTNAAPFTFVDANMAGYKQRFFRTFSMSP
jgi:hypothetical protein